MLRNWIKAQGFHDSACNPCLYIGDNKTRVIFFHIDDLLIAGNINQFIEKFLCKFKHLSAHPPNTLLGMKMERKDSLIHLSLPLNIKKWLEELGLKSSWPVSTLLTPGLHLGTAGAEERKLFLALNVNYCSPIGQLNFMTGLSRPDISFAVSSLARNCKEPGINHWKEVLRVWRYMNDTTDMMLILGPQ